MRLSASSLSLVLWVAGSAPVTGCKQAPKASSPAPAIALLLPESQAARYEIADRPFFESKFHELCPGVEVMAWNANQVAADQQQQAQAAIARGVKLVVLDPVDGELAGAIVNDAKARAIPVVSYDRVVRGGALPDYHVGYDHERSGKLAAEALLEKLAALGVAGPKIAMFDGAVTDPGALRFTSGAHAVFEGKATVVKEAVAARAEDAQPVMAQVIAAAGPGGFDAVFAASDAATGGAIAAMQAAGIDPATRPTIGRDADLAAIQRIVAGEQYATIYGRIQPEAEKAAELACALVKGQKPAAGLITGAVNNGTGDIRSVLLIAAAVSRAGSPLTQPIAVTVVKDRPWGPDSAARICNGHEAACTAANIK